MTIDTQALRENLQALDLPRLFIEGLGWNRPAAGDRRPSTVTVAGEEIEQRLIAELGGVVVVELRALKGRIPDAKTRAAIHRSISQHHLENLVIFLDRDRTQSLWYWVKRDGSRQVPREHLFVKGQPGDLILSKIAPMFVDISALDEAGNVSVVDAARRLQRALDVQPVTKRFYEEFREEHLRFTELVAGIDDERDRRWYASVLLNRLMFVYFLQRKGFLDDRRFDYLRDKLLASRDRGSDRFYTEFLKALFFEGFAKPAEERSAAATALVGDIVYLNGGLFLPHPVEQRWPNIDIPDRAFENLFGLFGRYSWNLDDTPGGQDNEINPDVLGYIFEKYINQKAFGAYYTPPEITEYLCEQTIHRLILDRVNQPTLPGITAGRHFETVPELLMALDARLCRELLFEVLPKLSLLDPACGSGAFLVAAMKTLIKIYSAITGKIDYLSDPALTDWLRKTRREHPSLNYFVKKKIITENLYGVDIMAEATDIARLRLFLALVSSVHRVEDLEPLPNIDFNILPGNSLIGLLRVDEEAYNRRGNQLEQRYNQIGMFRKTYRQLVDEKNRLVHTYRKTASWHDNLRELRDNIEQHRNEANDHLNEMLLDEFRRLGVKYEQATWDDVKGTEGKPKKRAVTTADIKTLTPFHWGYEFDQIMNERGGFDAIITNPPWEAIQPDAKEFFSDHSDLVTKKKMTVNEFETAKEKLLEDEEIRRDWLEYLSRFPYQNRYFRRSLDFTHQASVIYGKTEGTDLNLYKLFAERGFNMLRLGGQCGMVIASGICTDLGTKELRDLLFRETQITGLFGFENRRAIFDGVDRRFKFVVLTFEKGRVTTEFPVAFMQLDATELGNFPSNARIRLQVDLIRRLSPAALAVPELRDDLEFQIIHKAFRHPALGESVDVSWFLTFGRELHGTDDKDLFQSKYSQEVLPLFQGRMIHQFTHRLRPARYWLDETAARRRLVGKRGSDTGQKLNYECYRLGFREVASSTNERSVISTVLPKRVFTNHKIMLNQGGDTIPGSRLLYCSGIMNSFIFDYLVRQRSTTTVSVFIIREMPVPRIAEDSSQYRLIVDRAAKLICTTPEFDDLAREVGLRGHEDGVTEATERTKLRAELDGVIAHLYGLTEDEFNHILSTFPRVGQEVKNAAIEEFRRFAPKAGDPEVIALVERGECPTIEFKESVFWDQTKAKLGEKACWKTVAAFLNTDGGDLLIGVHDDGSIVGLEPDYARLTKRPDRDGWQQAVAQFLINKVKVPRMVHVRMTIHQVDGHDVCRIRVTPSPDPVWINENNAEVLYVRVGNTTRGLTGSDAAEYVRRNWSVGPTTSHQAN